MTKKNFSSSSVKISLFKPSMLLLRKKNKKIRKNCKHWEKDKKNWAKKEEVVVGEKNKRGK